MTILSRAIIVACALALSSCGNSEDQSAAPDMSAAQILALSHDYAPMLTGLLPDRQARSSAVSKDGRYIVEAYGNGSVIRLADHKGQELGTAQLDTQAQLLLMGPDGQVGAVLEDNSILVWKAGLEGKPVTLTIPGYKAFIQYQYRWAVRTPIALGRDTVAIGSYREGRGLWRIEDGQRLTSLTHDTGGFSFFKLSPDGEQLAAVQGGGMTVYRMSDGAFLGYFDNARTFDDTGSNEIKDIAFTENGKAIHVLGQGQWWHRMHLESAAIDELARPKNGSNMALSPDEKSMAYTGEAVQILSSDMAEGAEPVTLPLPGTIDNYDYSVMDMTFSPDETRLAAHIGSYREKKSRLVIWDIGQKLPIMDFDLDRQASGADYDVHLEPVFTPDGKTVIMAFPDGNAYILPATPNSLYQAAKQNGIEIKGNSE